MDLLKELSKLKNLVDIKVIRADNHAPQLEFSFSKPCDTLELVGALKALTGYKPVEVKPKPVVRVETKEIKETKEETKETKADERAEIRSSRW